MARIAVVDDANADIQMMESILKGANHSVVAYNNPTGVEDKLATVKPDLILLDIVMPQKNGYEVLRGLRKNDATKNIPVIVVSSKGEETDVAWGKRQGADGYVVKPFTKDNLLSAVGSLV